MRRSRLRQSSRISSKLVFVIVALAFVGSGYLIGRYFLASLLQRSSRGTPVNTNTGTSTNTTPGTLTAGQIQTRPLTVYRVQIGAFSNRENAERLASQASEKGIGAFVMNPDQMYRVFCAVTSSKDAADKAAASAQAKLAGSVIPKDEKLYVGTMSIPSFLINLNGKKQDIEKLQNALSGAEQALQSVLTFWDSLYLGQQNPVNFASVESAIASAKSSLSQMTPEAGLKSAHASVLKVLDEVESAVKAAKTAAGGDSAKTSEASKAFMKSLDTYVTELKKLAS